MDQPKSRTHGWRVHVQRKQHRLTMQFMDGKHGGKRKALQAARAWRDATLAKLEKMRERPHNHLCRFESGNKGRFWYGNIQSREKKLQKRFHDADYGGKQAALAAAIEWRDEILAMSEHDLWVRRTTQLRRDNRSGIVGVGRYVAVEISKGQRRTRAYWKARWSDENGKSRTRKFSVLKYGEDRARDLAIAAREAALKEAMLKRGRDVAA